jgi:hypothetical protein
MQRSVVGQLNTGAILEGAEQYHASQRLRRFLDAFGFDLSLKRELNPDRRLTPVQRAIF